MIDLVAAPTEVHALLDGEYRRIVGVHEATLAIVVDWNDGELRAFPGSDISDWTLYWPHGVGRTNYVVVR